MKVLALSVSIAFAIAACEGSLIAPTDCGAIPTGGCLDKGDAVDQCQDVSCTALFTCVDDSSGQNRGAWQPARECPVRVPVDRDASTDAGDAGDAGDAAPFTGDGGTIPDDLPPGAYGGPGCLSLQLPDCALSVGYACRTACCGCEELYVCIDRGWESWGVCENDVPTPH